MTADFFIQGRRVIVNAGRKRQPTTVHREPGARCVQRWRCRPRSGAGG